MAVVARLRDTIGRPSWRTAAAALALGGFTASAIAGSAAGTTNQRTKGVVVSTTKNATLGTLLVSGRTLYTLKASTTPCAATCLRVWPELLLPKGVKKATAGSGVDAAKLGTVKRRGGHRQVTYSRKALYWFSGDRAAGQVHGDLTDAWGTWSVVVMPTTNSSSPAPANAPAAPPSTPTTSPSTPTTGKTPAAAKTPAPTSAPTPAAVPTPAATPTTAAPASPPMTPSTSPPPPPPPTTPPTAPPTTTTTAPSSGGVSF